MTDEVIIWSDGSPESKDDIRVFKKMFGLKDKEVQ